MKKLDDDVNGATARDATAMLVVYIVSLQSQSRYSRCRRRMRVVGEDVCGHRYCFMVSYLYGST